MPYKIAVLMGGSSLEREFSLESGRYVTKVLEARGHQVLPLDTSATLVETLRTQSIDAVYIALHGKGGEDGTIQSLLEYLDIPYVGSSSQACRLAWNKSSLPHAITAYREWTGQCHSDTNDVAKLGHPSTSDVAQTSGPEVSSVAATLGSSKKQDSINPPKNPNTATWPESVSLSAIAFKDLGAATALDLIEQRIPSGYPLAVKPARGGSAMGVSKVTSQADLGSAALNALSYDSAVLIEKWIDGVELAVAVVGNGQETHVLPPVEIAPKQGFFDTDVRLDSDLVDYFCPVREQSLSPDKDQAAIALQAIEQAALEVHNALGCRDLSRIDMIFDGQKPVVLEVNVSPGMTAHSLVPMACAGAKIDFGQFVEHLLETAINR